MLCDRWSISFIKIFWEKERIIKILTRSYNLGISKQVVYEWEEDISKSLDVPFEYIDSYVKYPITRVLRKLKNQ